MWKSNYLKLSRWMKMMQETALDTRDNHSQFAQKYFLDNNFIKSFPGRDCHSQCWLRDSCFEQLTSIYDFFSSCFPQTNKCAGLMEKFCLALFSTQCQALFLIIRIFSHSSDFIRIWNDTIESMFTEVKDLSGLPERTRQIKHSIFVIAPCSLDSF